MSHYYLLHTFPFVINAWPHQLPLSNKCLYNNDATGVKSLESTPELSSETCDCSCCCIHNCRSHDGHFKMFPSLNCFLI